MDGSNCYYHQVNREFIETYWNGLVNVKEEEKLQVKFDSDVKSE
jgi:hypothetical protein